MVLHTSLLAYGKVAGLDFCFSSVVAWHGAPRANQYHRSRLGVVNLSQFTHHLSKLGYFYQEERGGSLTTVE